MVNLCNDSVLDYSAPVPSLNFVQVMTITVESSLLKLDERVQKWG